MAVDRQGIGLALLRICIGVFFLFEGLAKIRWFADTSILGARFADWTQAAAVGSASHWYLQRIAEPGLAVFARLVPLGEIACGIAMIIGFWTPLFAFIAFFMALNFNIASGAMTAWPACARVARAESADAEARFSDVRQLTDSFLFEFDDAIRNLTGSMPAR